MVTWLIVSDKAGILGEIKVSYKYYSCLKKEKFSYTPGVGTRHQAVEHEKAHEKMQTEVFSMLQKSYMKGTEPEKVTTLKEN